MKKFILSTLLTFTLFTQNAFAIETIAKEAILYEPKTKTVLFEKEADIAVPPASMSKLMTVYVIFDALKKGEIKLEDKYQVSEKAWKEQGSKMFVAVNEEVSINDLLHGVIIQSGNDATVVLAEGFAGSVEAFVEKMNEKAEELGLENSHFTNTNGMPNPDHLMSPRDLAILSGHIIEEFPEYYKIYSKKEFTWNNIKQGNRNPLLYMNFGADGIKTGHTEEAGYCLVGSAKKDGLRLISVVTGLETMKDRGIESKKLLQWGLREFGMVHFVKGHYVKDIPVWVAEKKAVKAVLGEDYSIFMKKSDIEKGKVTTQLTYIMPAAPIKKGDKIAEVVVKHDDKVHKIPVLADENVAKDGFLGRAKAAIDHFILN